MTKSTGAFRLAATVWPISTFREMTVPSIGERIVQRARSTSARCKLASLICTVAFICASVAVRRIDICLRRGFLREQLFFPLRSEARQFQRRFRLGKVAFRLIHRGLVSRGIEFGDHLAALSRTS